MRTKTLREVEGTNIGKSMHIICKCLNSYITSIFSYVRYEYSHIYDEVEEVRKNIANQTKYKPTIGVICGSGLSALGDLVQEKDVIPYDKIPQFPKSTGMTNQCTTGLEMMTGQPSPSTQIWINGVFAVDSMD